MLVVACATTISTTTTKCESSSREDKTDTTDDGQQRNVEKDGVRYTESRKYPHRISEKNMCKMNEKQ